MVGAAGGRREERRRACARGLPGGGVERRCGGGGGGAEEAREAAASTGGREGGGSEATARRGDVSEAMARRGGDRAARIWPESTARRGRAGCSAEGPARARTAEAMDVDVRERKKGGMETAKSRIPLYATQFSTGLWLRPVLNWRQARLVPAQNTARY